MSVHHKLMQFSVCELQCRINSEERGLHVETFTLMKKDSVIHTGNSEQEIMICKQGEATWRINSDNVFCTPHGSINWTQSVYSRRREQALFMLQCFKMLSMLVVKKEHESLSPLYKLQQDT